MRLTQCGYVNALLNSDMPLDKAPHSSSADSDLRCSRKGSELPSPDREPTAEMTAVATGGAEFRAWREAFLGG